MGGNTSYVILIYLLLISTKVYPRRIHLASGYTHEDQPAERIRADVSCCRESESGTRTPFAAKKMLCNFLF